jgi:transglutaminase-like putative cysteine protease
MARPRETRGTITLIILCILLLFGFIIVAIAALYPSADGVVLYNDNGTTVDASNIDQGYIMVKHTPSEQSLKMRITCGNEYYTYDLDTNEQYETFVLPFGSGKYELQVFRHVSGKRYSNDASIRFSATIINDAQPYLYPNQYICYTADSKAVAKAAEICAGSDSDESKLIAIRKYIVDNILYDFVLASTVQSGYIPVVDNVLASGKGICFDYAALTACMLRSQNIPTKLEIGYADKIYHAWNSVLIGKEWIQIDTTAEANHMNIGKYTIERIY